MFINEISTRISGTPVIPRIHYSVPTVPAVLLIAFFPGNAPLFHFSDFLIPVVGICSGAHSLCEKTMMTLGDEDDEIYE